MTATKTIIVVNDNPAIIATSSAIANSIPISDSNGSLNSWITKNQNPAPRSIVISNDDSNVLTWTPITLLAIATGSITNTSTSDILATGMTLTPVSGIYDVDFSSTMGNSTAGSNVLASIYVGGVQVASSLRTITSAAANRDGFVCVAQVTVNGSQAIEGRWSVVANTGTMLDRVLRIRKVG